MPQVRVQDADIYYEELGAGEPLLILHGMLETGHSYARLMLTLSATYHVILPDLRGYGRSGPRPRTFPSDFYQRDAAEMAAFLRHLGLHGVRVIGVADGAEVALLLAISAPELIQAVVALSVAGAFPPGMETVLGTLGAWVEDTGSEHRAWRSEAIREYTREGAQALWAGWKAAVQAILAAGGDISQKQAGAIRCPVLIVNGANDRVNTPAVSRALAASIPHAEVHLVPNAGQLLADKYLPQFRIVVLAWLAQH